MSSSRSCGRLRGARPALYKQHIQEDDALARRFRCVHVAEPSIEDTRGILYKLRPRLERNYGVHIRDEAIDTALEMSPRYMRHLRLPDGRMARYGRGPRGDAAPTGGYQG